MVFLPFYMKILEIFVTQLRCSIEYGITVEVRATIVFNHKVLRMDRCFSQPQEEF